MKQNQILHVMILDKFLAPFIDFVDEHFGRENHHYVFITSEKYDYGLTPEHKVEFLHTDDDIFITLLEYMKQARKIILHGLWRDKVDILLYFNQELLKKCYWAMWGGDFYFPEKHSHIKKQVIRKMGCCVTGNDGEFKYIQKNYNTEGKKINVIVSYPSNLYRHYEIMSKKNTTINIQLGNSATKTNNHFAVLDQLAKYKDQNIKIFTPLSYGDHEYAKSVIAKGKEIFDNKFVPLTKFLPLDQYLEFLSKIDMAIFDHNRQQAFGNIILLLGLGKKVYINPQVTTWSHLTEMGISIFDSTQIDIFDINVENKNNNSEIIQKTYSLENLKKDWQKIFQDRLTTDE